MKKTYFAFCITIILVVTLLGSSPAIGKIGVGINIGKIEVNEPLFSGGTYDIAKMTVINTGDETSDYTLDISYLEGQKQLKPEKKWFIFSPVIFSLKPGQAKQVEIKMALPIQTRAGDYFAFVEGRPIPQKKGLSVGVAAAAKLTFSVKSSSLFWSVYNWALSVLAGYSPYSYILIGLALLIMAWLIFRRFFSFSLRLERRDKEK